MNVEAFVDMGGSNLCYNIGDIKGTTRLGGIIGYATGQSISKCISTFSPLLGINGTATDCTVCNLSEVSNKVLALPGSNFVADSRNINGGYPILKWQTEEWFLNAYNNAKAILS